jgi:hypothetical protein
VNKSLEKKRKLVVNDCAIASAITKFSDGVKEIEKLKL